MEDLRSTSFSTFHPVPFLRFARVVEKRGTKTGWPEARQSERKTRQKETVEGPAPSREINLIFNQI